MFGLQGYLATITSAEENAFVFDKLQGNGWLGGTDADVEGDWTWVTGPDAGTVFCIEQNGTCVPQNDPYNNWDGGEPNNGSIENYLHMIGNTALNEGTWNNLPVTGGDGVYEVKGYVIEYGGSDSDPTLQLSGTVIVHVVAVDGGGGCDAGESSDPIIASIDDLTGEVDDLVTQNGIVTALNAKLRAARASLEKGNDKAATNQLGAFVKFVSTRIGKQFSSGQADDLISDANAIICAIDPAKC